eukprot:528090-Hanusia_phi.AAC.1
MISTCIQFFSCWLVLTASARRKIWPRQAAGFAVRGGGGEFKATKGYVRFESRSSTRDVGSGRGRLARKQASIESE